MSAPRLGHYDLCAGVCFGCMQCGFLRKPRCIGWCEECWGHWVMVPGPRHNRFIPPEFRIRNLGVSLRAEQARLRRMRRRELCFYLTPLAPTLALPLPLPLPCPCGLALSLAMALVFALP